jgi:Icc-related predicted phosphoesterase
MRALAFTDVHGSKAAFAAIAKKALRADFLLCAGDVTVFQHGMRKILKFINGLGKPVFIIHGNHEDELEFGQACAGLKNIQFIHRKLVEYRGLHIAGYGGGGFSITDPSIDVFARKLSTVRHDNLVFLVHAPPYGTELDEIDGSHHGNKSVRDFIRLLKPALTVCGHLHENFNRRDIIQGCLIINPGPKGRILRHEPSSGSIRRR